jgi:hypothetical protein
MGAHDARGDKTSSTDRRGCRDSDDRGRRNSPTGAGAEPGQTHRPADAGFRFEDNNRLSSAARVDPLPPRLCEDKTAERRGGTRLRALAHNLLSNIIC